MNGGHTCITCPLTRITRDRGYGTQLMDHFEAKLRTMDVAKYHLLIEQSQHRCGGFLPEAGLA